MVVPADAVKASPADNTALSANVDFLNKISSLDLVKVNLRSYI
jgi:hypothetical protein